MVCYGEVSPCSKRVKNWALHVASKLVGIFCRTTTAVFEITVILSDSCPTVEFKSKQHY